MNAADFPDHDITSIAPYAPGGGSDGGAVGLLERNEQLVKALGQ